MKQGELNQDALLGALIGAIADCVFGIWKKFALEAEVLQEVRFPRE
jgi:hypothetical protein